MNELTLWLLNAATFSMILNIDGMMVIVIIIIDFD